MIDSKYITHNREPFYEIVNKYIDNDSCVLDIGAGDGSFSKYFKRDDFYLYDGNINNIDILKKKYKNVYYGKLPNLPFENTFFDIIHCSHVIEHLYPEELYETLKEMDRCLKNNGYIIISTPLLWYGFYDDLSHVKPYNPEVLLKYFCYFPDTILTREHISKNYIKKELIYRYREVDLLENIYNTKNNFLIAIIIKIMNFLYRLGLRKYIKIGYTIVIQKNNIEKK